MFICLQNRQIKIKGYLEIVLGFVILSWSKEHKHLSLYKKLTEKDWNIRDHIIFLDVMSKQKILDPTK